MSEVGGTETVDAKFLGLSLLLPGLSDSCATLLSLDYPWISYAM